MQARARADEVVRAIAYEGTISVVVVHSTEIARTLARVNDAGPIGAVALARVAAATLLLGTTIKGHQQVGLQINGTGPMGELYAIGDAHGQVRATIADSQVQLEGQTLGHLKLAKVLGLGRMTVIKRLAADEPAYRGIVPLVTGEIAEDLTGYFQESEQINSAVGLGEWFTREGIEVAGGFLIRALPGASDEVLAAVEARVKALPPLGELLRDDDDPEVLLRRLVESPQILDRYPATHLCPCTREQFARNLVSLGTEELTRLAADQELTEVTCHFCRTVYTFDRPQISALIYGAGLSETP